MRVFSDLQSGGHDGMTDIQVMARSGPSDGDRPAFPQHAALRGSHLPHLLRDELLSEIFAASAREHATSVCMVSGGLRLTYADVDARALSIARGLRRKGAAPGKVVGLWMARGTELLIAQIAIAKTGAAWLPFDSDAPAERVAECLRDCEAALLLTDEGHAAKAAGVMPCEIVLPQPLVDPDDHSAVDARALGCTPDHPAYMIYTSGSTGKPKGIVITGRNICHYLRSANEVYGLVASDVVFQGASVAFDLSMEEIWVPYLVGARLFVATPEIMGEADKLPDVMEQAGVTVLDTVPTLLSMLPRDIASLRVIILGGEACPPAIAERWCKPGRRIFNSYGPTEATVVATVAEVRNGEPVTIGKPIPNYTCYVASESLELLAPGQEGELLIGGPGVAMGYLGRPDLTAEKFIANPFDAQGADTVLYRSGDAVALDANGDILFRGRIDDQIKIRGFRVELGEIEARLADLEGVGQAAVVLRNDDGMDQLVAFLVPEGGNSAVLEPKVLRAKLRETLPAYMVPARYEAMSELPRLSSGKVNRNELKKVALAPAEITEEQEDPRTDTEAKLLDAAKAVLPPQSIPFDADFFTDLGGHSLLAAKFLGKVREHAALASLTLQDVYAARTLRAMAALLDGRAASMGPQRDLRFEPPPLRRRFFCGLAQAVTLPFIFALVTAKWLGVFISYMLLTGPDAKWWQEIITLMGVYVLINVSTLCITIAAKWLIIGRTKPGRYPLWGVYHYRLWVVQRLATLAHMKWLQGSPLLPIYMRALGARIGKDVVIGDLDVGAADLVTIGDRASLGGKIKLSNAHVEGNELIIGPIVIGADAYVGTSCVIENDCVIGEGAEMRDLSAIPAGTHIGAWEVWDGSPARHVEAVDQASLPAQADATPARRNVNLFFYVAAFLCIPPLGLLPIFPAFWVFDKMDDWLGTVDRTSYLMSIPLMAWPMAFALVIFTVGLVVAIRWSVLPRVRTGRYSIYSSFYLRKWVVQLTTEVTLDTLSSLFATIYMRNWYRLLGTGVGKDAEVSTNLAGRYDLINIGEKNFIADEVVLGDEDIRRGWMYLDTVDTGARVFVGNDAVVPIGTRIPEGVLIGIKSKPPANEMISPGDTWFGSPPIKLPVRQRFDGGGANWTYEPSFWRKLLRASFEAIHISFPTMLFITGAVLSIEIISEPLMAGEYSTVAVYFMLAALFMTAFMSLTVVLVKWMLMGVYKPVIKPMWSWWAMRTEAVAVLYSGLAGKVLMEHLRGTPFLPWYLRLFGVKMGKGNYMDAFDITEFDCVRVGDYCVLNSLCALQTHLYEDRVMKVGRVYLGDGVTVGAAATVLYDTNVGDFAQLGPLTVVMKGESIPGNSAWIGAPAEPFVHVHNQAHKEEPAKVAA
jgi:non-ribosomal peptide synthetase-like protein